MDCVWSLSSLNYGLCHLLKMVSVIIKPQQSVILELQHTFFFFFNFWICGIKQWEWVRPGKSMWLGWGVNVKQGPTLPSKTTCSVYQNQHLSSKPKYSTSSKSFLAVNCVLEAKLSPARLGICYMSEEDYACTCTTRKSQQIQNLLNVKYSTSSETFPAAIVMF